MKRVYLALTEVTKAGKLAIAPQCRTTNGGLGFFWPALCVGRHAAGEQLLDGLDHAAVLLPVASKNISRVSLHGSDPLNSGGPAFFAPLAVFRSHFAAFWIVTSLGLNWNVDATRDWPGLRRR